MKINNSNAAIYARTASISQSDTVENNSSLQKQIEGCIKYCNLNELKVVQVYTEVANGKGEKHALKTCLIDAIIKKKFKIIVVSESSRLSRNLDEYLEIVEVLQKSGITVITTNTPLDDDTIAVLQVMVLPKNKRR